MNHLELAKNLEPEHLDNIKFWRANIILFICLIICYNVSWGLIIPSLIIWGIFIFKSVKWDELQRKHTR